MPYWRALDGLRAFAVLIVFIGHVKGTPLPGGFIGVDVFFVLSGFLITGVLLRERAERGKVSLRAFFARRTLRLYPALLLLAAVAVPMTALSTEPSYTVRGTVISMVAALTYSFNIVTQLSGPRPSLFGNLWSLSVEEQFYLLWAPLVALFTAHFGLGRRTGRGLVWLVVAAQVLLLLVAAVWGHRGLRIAYFFLHGHLVELLLGSLLAWLVLVGLSEPLRRIMGSSVTPGASVTVLLVAAFSYGRVDWYELSGYAMVLVYPALGLCSAMLIGHIVVSEGSWATRVLGHPVPRWLGRRSYAFYLFHRPLLYLVEEHITRRSSVVVVGLALSLLAAELSWRLVEAPALAQKHRFARTPLTDSHAQPPTT